MRSITYILLLGLILAYPAIAGFGMDNNLLANGDAETGDLSFWHTISNIQVTSSAPAGGQYAFQTTGAGDANPSSFVHNAFLVNKSKKILLKLDYKTSLGAPIPMNSSVAKIRFYNASSTFISEEILALSQTSGVWTTFDLIVTPPAGATQGDVFIYVVEESGAYIDNVGVYEETITYYTAENLIKNPDAESPVDFEHWFHKGGVFTSVNRTDSATTGTSSFQMDNTSDVFAYVDIRTPLIPVEPEEKMMIKFYYKTLPGFNAINPTPLAVNLRYWGDTSYGTFKGELYIPLAPTNGQWVQHIEEFVVGADAAIQYMDVVLYMNYPEFGDGIARWDGFELYSANAPVIFDKTNNLFLNGGAELGDTTYWSTAINVAASTTVVESGIYSFGFATGPRPHFVHETVAVTPGEELLLEVSSYTAPSVTTTNASYMQLRFFNAANAIVASPWVDLPITNGNWTLNTIQTVVPAGAVVADLYITSEFNGMSYVDNVGLYRAVSVIGPFDLTHLRSMASEWLDNDLLPLLSDNVLDGFESYSSQSDLTIWWGLTSGSYPSGGTSTVTLLTNPADTHSGSKAMRWSYNNSGTGRVWTEFNRILPTAIDFSRYNEFRVWLNRHAGNSQEELFYVKFYNGSVAESNILAEAWVTPAQGSSFSPVGWSEWVINLDQMTFTRGATSKNDLDSVVGFFFGVVGDTTTQGLGSGIIDFDDITLVNTTANCGGNPPTWDLTGDCMVNLKDFAVLAAYWSN